MPNAKDYNLDYRPHSYWGPQELKTHFGSRAKGELRREAGLELLGEGIADSRILATSLSDDERQAVGAVHPWFMGGEYLPDYLPKEVEIARVTMKSTTMDIISVRARQTKHRIKYRILDEYESEGYLTYSLVQKSSIKPLTLRQLITLMDNAIDDGLVGSARECNYSEGGMSPEEIYNFETASSAFYAELAHWYDAANEEWLETQLERDYLERFLDGTDATRDKEIKWREENKEMLENEVKLELHAVYEQQYLKQQPPESQDEIEWRAINSNRLKEQLKFVIAVDSCLEAAEWYKVKGSMAWGNSFNSNKVKNYVEQYLTENGEVPLGEHDVDNFTVTFRGSDNI